MLSQEDRGVVGICVPAILQVNQAFMQGPAPGTQELSLQVLLLRDHTAKNAKEGTSQGRWVCSVDNTQQDQDIFTQATQHSLSESYFSLQGHQSSIFYENSPSYTAKETQQTLGRVLLPESVKKGLGRCIYPSPGYNLLSQGLL